MKKNSRLAPSYILLLVLFSTLQLMAKAQVAISPPQSQPSVQLYLFTAIGAVSGAQVGPSIPVPPYKAWHVGGAAEKFLSKGFSAGMELAKTPRKIRSSPLTYTYRNFSGQQSIATSTANAARGWLTLNGSYHFNKANSTSKFIPFITAGCGIFVREEPSETINYGGGFTYWPSRHFGYRIDYRKFRVAEAGYDSHLRSVRFGITLR